MKEEQLVALGISKENIAKILGISKDDMKDMIPKHRFDEVNTAKSNLEGQLKTANKQIEDLKKFEGTNDELQKKITGIQTEMQQKETEYKANLDKLTKKNLIKVGLLALENRPYDVDIVAGLLNDEQILLDANNEKIVSGFTEQIENLRKDKAFLFSAGKGDPKPQGNPPPDGHDNPPNEDKDIIDFGKRLAQAKLSSMGIQGGKKE